MSWLRRLFGARPRMQAARPLTPEMLARIRSSFDESSRDEEHFPSAIDPRIYHVRLIADHLGEFGGRRILDAGCGKGRFARVFLEQHPGARLHGMDISEAMLRHAAPKIERCAASLTSLPYADEAFDGAYATESLEHAVDVEAAVAELCRVVKRGGRIAVIDKNAEHWGRLKTPDWERWFTREELTALLQKHCREVSSRFISYWEDVEPDGLFLAWLAVK